MSEFVSSYKVKARHFHDTNCFIGDLATLNDGGFNGIYKDIYTPELQLKVKHSVTHATFFNLDITIKDGVFISKIFDKHDVFPFFIFRMPYVDSDIPKPIFHSANVGEFF